MRDRAQDATGTGLEEAREVRELARLEERIDDVERRRVEAYDGDVWSGHERSISLVFAGGLCGLSGSHTDALLCRKFTYMGEFV
jgi:hypothetical protein